MPIKDLYNVSINHIDQAIYESEQEVLSGTEAVDADVVFTELEKKYFV